jgi:GT2 family glycosyltransferase
VRVVILVPRREDGGWRDRLWAHCRSVWEREFPDWPVAEGHHLAEEGPFNRSAAVNRAAHADATGDWDVALVIDSDTVSEPAAVRAAVELAGSAGTLCIAHDRRLMLDKRGTDAVLAGRRPNLRSNVQRVWTDSVSCAVAVRRDTWDAARGFDERFVGWGYEDTAFQIACETVTGRVAHRERADCVHLWHPSPPEAARLSPTRTLNWNLKLRYQAVHWDRAGLTEVLDGNYEARSHSGPIPKVLHRTVPAAVDPQAEAWWEDFATLHPGWELKTWRDPLDAADFPLTAHLHPRCASGAQKAGLVRLELLVTHGGVYVDSDVQPVRPLDALTHLPAFAAWEDERVVPDAVMGAAPQHPAFRQMLARAVRLIELGSQDAWETGPGGTTEMLPGRDDVLLLPPGSFYPVHYKEKAKLGTRNDLPWVFLEHKRHHSWDPRKSPAPASAAKAGAADAPRDVAVLIPWRPSGDHRRQDAFKWCSAWWAEHGLPTVVGSGQSRAEMCNDAARRALAEGYRVLVFADADTWAPAQQVLEAAERARAGVLVHAFDVYSRLASGTTTQGLRVPRASINPRRYAAMGTRTAGHVSGLSAVSAELWARVGGFDERFERWGFEDQAFHLACEVLGDGPPERVGGAAIHWAHRADPAKAAGPDGAATALMAAYCEAAGRVPEHGRTGKLARRGVIAISAGGPDADSMRDILSGPGGPLCPPDAVS